MATQDKTFKVECAHCQRPFHVRFPLADSEAEGSGEVVVACLYCNENVVINIPREYIEEDMLVRGVKSGVAGE
jgi:hypothetical protein